MGMVAIKATAKSWVSAVNCMMTIVCCKTDVMNATGQQVKVKAAKKLYGLE